MSFIKKFLNTRTTTSKAATQDGAYYEVAGVGKFNTHLSVDFTKVSALPSTLKVDTYTVGPGSAPFQHQFMESNVVLNKGNSLSLLVPGGQNSSPIASSEIRTSYDDILYASVRTVAKASTSAGTCHGLFFYLDDNQESDIEILTSTPDVVHFTNQPLAAGDAEMTTTAKAPSTMTSAYHEYRIDWVPGKTMFYINGVLKKTMTKNVPTEAGSWVWNNWSSGGNSWTKGPPVETSDLRIQSINAYFNRTSVTAAAEKAAKEAKH